MYFSFYAFVLLLCNGCKFFKKSTAKTVDTITADTTPVDAEIIDSAALFPVMSMTQWNAVTCRGIQGNAVGQVLYDSRMLHGSE